MIHALAVAAVVLAAPLVQERTAELHEVREVLDLAYHEGEDADPKKHKLDLYLPEDVEAPPLLLWIHGGAWAVGDRKQEAELARRFAERGIACAAMSYRLSPAEWMDPSLTTGIEHPEHAIDVARAFAWLHEHADTYGYDRDKMFPSGFSAGGHLSALIAMDARYLASHDLPLTSIRAAIPVSGGYDIESYHQILIEGMGKETADGHVLGVFGKDAGDLVHASPLTYFEGSTIPMLVISDKETRIYTEPLVQAVAEAGVKHIEFLDATDHTHASLYLAMRGKGPEEFRDRIVAFVREHSAPRAEAASE